MNDKSIFQRTLRKNNLQIHCKIFKGEDFHTELQRDETKMGTAGRWSIGNGHVYDSLTKGLNPKVKKGSPTVLIYGVALYINDEIHPNIAVSLRVLPEFRIAVPHGIQQNDNQKYDLKRRSFILHSFWALFVRTCHPKIDYMFVKPIQSMAFLLLEKMKFADDSWVPIAVGMKDMMRLDNETVKNQYIEDLKKRAKEKEKLGKDYDLNYDRHSDPYWQFYFDEINLQYFEDVLKQITTSYVFQKIRTSGRTIFNSPFDDSKLGTMKISYEDGTEGEFNRRKFADSIFTCCNKQFDVEPYWGYSYDQEYWKTETPPSFFLGRNTPEPQITVKISDLVRIFKEYTEDVVVGAKRKFDTLQLLKF